MWKELEIAKQLYFLRCSIADNQVLCLFCDFSTPSEYLCETISVEDFIKRSKQLNKRIKYDEVTICDTVQLSVPLDAFYDGANVEGGDGAAQKVLSLKYRVHSMPYKIEWHLRHLTPDELRNYILLPLFTTVHGMSQQIAELIDVVRKKDVEILQYKTEGNILRRTTVATQPFNILQFDEKYAETTDLSRSFGKVASYLQVDTIGAPKKTEKDETTNKMEEDESVKTEEHNVPTSSKLSPKKTSPKHRKRKALQAQRMHLLRKISARQKTLNYRSSQSQSQSEETDAGDNGDNNELNLCIMQEKTEAYQQPITVLAMPSPTTTTTAALSELRSQQTLPVLPTFINAMDSPPSPTLPATPPNSLAAATAALTGTQTILSIAEMNQKLDFILKELKNLEEQRIADMKKRLGGKFD